MDQEYKKHYSVFNREVLNFFKETEASSNIFGDFTFGGGGHSLEILRQLESSKVVACDQDPEALENGNKLIQASNLEDRINLFRCNFEDFPNILKEGPLADSDGLAGIVIDLGVSSHHFDSAERGFSFRFEGPLDMRMDPDNDDILTAKDIVNTFEEEEIARIIFEYGEDKFSRRIARVICEERAKAEIKTTKDLENIVFHAYPKKFRFSKAHPATKTFQALRIFVNRELEVIENVIPKILPVLESGGMLCVITFHSLEDRIVKHCFKRMKLEKVVKVLTKKPILPSEDELNENNRSRSAKLRVLRKL